MCLPAIPLVMAGLTAASTAVGVAGSLMQGRQAAAAGRAQQAAYNASAESERLASGYEATREFERGRKVNDQAMVSIAGSGVTLAGSPTEALAENAGQNQLDIEAIQYNSKMKQNQLKTQGVLAKMQGDQKKQASTISAISTGISGVSSFFNPQTSFNVGNWGKMFA